MDILMWNSHHTLSRENFVFTSWWNSQISIRSHLFNVYESMKRWTQNFHTMRSCEISKWENPFSVACKVPTCIHIWYPQCAHSVQVFWKFTVIISKLDKMKLLKQKRHSELNSPCISGIWAYLNILNTAIVLDLFNVLIDHELHSTWPLLSHW